MTRQIYMQQMQALGTDIELRLVSSADKDLIEKQFTILWEAIVDFENMFSRFKPDSELSQFNHKAGAKVHISELFRELLLTVEKISAMTGGNFNPFVLPNLQRAGYIHSMTNTHLVGDDYSKRELVGCDSIEVGDDWARIPENTALDFGGIGKGYLADRLATLFPDQGIEGYCLSLGGDMIVKGLDEHEKHWNIDIQSDTDRTKNIATFQGAMDTFGIATSAIMREKNGEKQQHQIDPRTGLPLESTFTMVTTVAKDATMADVTASYVLSAGEDVAKKLIAENTLYAVLLQSRTGYPVALGEGFSMVK